MKCFLKWLFVTIKILPTLTYSIHSSTSTSSDTLLVSHGPMYSLLYFCFISNSISFSLKKKRNEKERKKTFRSVIRFHSVIFFSSRSVTACKQEHQWQTIKILSFSTLECVVARVHFTYTSQFFFIIWEIVAFMLLFCCEIVFILQRHFSFGSRKWNWENDFSAQWNFLCLK